MIFAHSFNLSVIFRFDSDADCIKQFRSSCFNFSNTNTDQIFHLLIRVFCCASKLSWDKMSLKSWMYFWLWISFLSLTFQHTLIRLLMFEWLQISECLKTEVWDIRVWYIVSFFFCERYLETFTQLKTKLRFRFISDWSTSLCVSISRQSRVSCHVIERKLISKFWHTSRNVIKSYCSEFIDVIMLKLQTEKWEQYHKSL